MKQLPCAAPAKRLIIREQIKSHKKPTKKAVPTLPFVALFCLLRSQNCLHPTSVSYLLLGKASQSASLTA
jgi:hypothetical protein